MEPITHSQPQLLRRNTRDGKIAGVAAGLGDYFRVDPVLVRLALVLLVLAGGFGLLVYLVAWLVMPPADPTQDIAPALERRLPRSRWNIRSLAGGLLVVIGAIAFLAVAGSWWLPNIDAWPLILIAAGAGLLLLRARQDGGTVADAETDAETDAATEEAAHPAEEEAVAADEATDATEEPVQAASVAPSTSAMDIAEPTPTTYATPPARRRVSVGWITLGALVLAGAVAALLDNLGTIDISAQTFLLVALAICGAGLVASAFFGRRLAIVGLFVVVAAALGVAALPNTLSLTSGAGERVVRPASIGELEESYELGAGTLTLDLRQLAPIAGETLIEVDVGVGELVVLFPADVNGTIDGHTTLGEVELFGHTDSGVSVSGSRSVAGSAPRVTTAGPSMFPVPTRSRIVVDAEVGIGRLEARRAA